MARTRFTLTAGLLLAGLLMTASVPRAWSEAVSVNINTASASELSSLKGIGNAKALGIIAYREKNGPFKSVDDLRQVSGIGEKLLNNLRPQVTVAAPAAPPAAKH